MAKTKDKKKAKAALPKRIAGVKVPKGVRNSRFGELLASRTGQALIAEALLGAGAVAAGAKASQSPKVRHLAHDTKESAVHAGEEASHDVAAAGATLAYALGEAARTFAEALRHPPPVHADDGRRARAAAREEDEEPAWAPDYGGPDSAPEAPTANAGGRSARKKQAPAQEAGPL